ncbi:WD40-repeat-containing domain protein [Zopfochytrium polystomum]|nr:WD40-repeat-containing domain protein [Zopfochytrium polystomum]
MIDRTARVVAFDEDEAGDDEESGDVSAPPLPQAQQPKSKPPQLVPLWTDDSIDDIDVDIATGAARLRKLRAYPSEKKVAGSEYELRLRRQFEKLHPTPAWAHLSEDTDSASVVGRETSLLLRSTRAMIDKSLGSGRRLLSSSILMHRAKDANFTAPSTALLESCKFHPSVPVMLTAGGDRTLRLFGIDGRRNEKIQSVFFRDLPIFSADFTIDGRQVVVAGRRKFFFVYDIQAGAVNKIPGIRGRDEKSFEKFKMSPCGRFIAFLGRDGYIVLVSRDSMQWIANLKMNGSIRAMDFTKDGRFLYSIGSDGEVYQWDLGARSCVHRFVDEGAIHSTTIAVSPDSSFIATGSNSGIVNVYASSTALYSSNPSPAKCLDSLTTSIAHLAFHPSSQALVFSSRLKKDALRIAHLPSLNVFPNWPTSSTPLSYVHSLDWSPGGGFLAIGNEKGRALLYRAAEFDAC